MESDEREKEIQDILSDLDGILQSLTGRPPAAAPPAPKALEPEPPPPSAPEAPKEPVKEELPVIELAAAGVSAPEKKEPVPEKESPKEEPPAKLPGGPPLEITAIPEPAPFSAPPGLCRRSPPGSPATRARIPRGGENHRARDRCRRLN